MEKLNWCIIGTGKIANEFASQFHVENAQLYGVASKTKDQAEQFAKNHQVEKVFGSYEEVLECDSVDVVYIATPHNYHYDMIIKALESGKNVVCEKSITISKAQLERAVELAQAKNLYLFEAMTIHYMPLYQNLKEWAKEHEVGKLKMVQVNFGSFKDLDPSFYYFNKDLAGGALLDIGVYAINFARWFLTSRPTEIRTLGNIHETGVDESSAIILQNQERELATISLTFRAKMPKQGIVAYENGYFTITDYPRADRATFTNSTGEVTIIEAGHSVEGLNYEANVISNIILQKKANPHLSYTLDVMEVMEKVRNDWGLHYSFEDE